MKQLRYLLAILAFFPWLDFVIRKTLPAFAGSIWDDLFLAVFLLAVWFFQARQQGLPSLPKEIKWPLSGFFLLSLLSVVVHIVPLAVSIDALRVVFQPMLFGFCAFYLLGDEENLQWFLKLLLVSTLGIALFGIIQYIFQIDTGLWVHQKDSGQFRIISIFSNPNALAAYFNMALGFLLGGVLLFKKKTWKIACALAAVPVFIALLLTFSRSSWIAFLVMVLYFVFIWDKRWLLAVPVALGLTPFIMPGQVIGRFAKLLDPVYYQTSMEYGRLAFWATALEKIKEHPFLGVGLGMFGDSVALRHKIPFATWVDNHYLKLGAEIGLPGLLCFLLLLAACFFIAHKLYVKAGSDFRGVVALGLAGAVITMSIQNVTASIWEALVDAIYFYALMSVLVALVCRERRKDKELHENSADNRRC